MNVLHSRVGDGDRARKSGRVSDRLRSSSGSGLIEGVIELLLRLSSVLRTRRDTSQDTPLQ